MLSILEAKRPPTAVFASSDYLAIGALRAIRQKGLSIPRDISIVGFDDMPLTDLFDPPLTAIRQPVELLGRTGFQRLFALMNGKRPAPITRAAGRTDRTKIGGATKGRTLMAKRVLIAGESWTVHSIHQKGFDSFTTTEYAEGVRWLRAALEGGGWKVDFMPSHVAARDFPARREALAAYDCVMLSDIGANTLLLHPDTFVQVKGRCPTGCIAIRDYVAKGGGLVMIGGYMTFQGIEAKAQYAGTRGRGGAAGDHRPERRPRRGTAGRCAEGQRASHPIVAGVKVPGPPCSATTGSRRSPAPTLVAKVGDDPLIVAGTFKARAARSPSPPTADRTGRRRPSSSGAATRRSGTASPTGRPAHEQDGRTTPRSLAAHHDRATALPPTR